MGECHNKRRGVITDLSVLPPSGPAVFISVKSKHGQQKCQFFVQYRKKVFNAPKLRVH